MITSNSKFEAKMEQAGLKIPCAPSGASFGSELEPLTQLLDINSSETQLLFSQLSQLKNHLGVVIFK